MEEGKLQKDSRYVLKQSDYIGGQKVNEKSFGALEYLHEGTELTVEDLYRLSIAVSDNVAFNILYRMLGEETINQTLDALGRQI